MAIGIVCDALRGEHHGHIYIAGEVSEPLSVTGVGKAREVKGVLMRRSRDDGVDFSSERQPDGGLHGVAGDAAGANDAIAILVQISTAEAPHSDGDSVLCRYAGDLVFGTYEGDVGIEGVSQRVVCDLRTDTARIAKRHRD